MEYKSKRLLNNLKVPNFLPALAGVDREILIEVLEIRISVNENDRFTISDNCRCTSYENDCGEAFDY
jgi:hypothetical protein